MLEKIFTPKLRLDRFWGKAFRWENRDIQPVLFQAKSSPRPLVSLNRLIAPLHAHSRVVESISAGDSDPGEK